MKPLKIILLLFYHSALLWAQQDLHLDCNSGQMASSEVWSCYKTVIAPESAIHNRFIIRSTVNDLSDAKFISDIEHYYRQASENLDTINFPTHSYAENWKDLSSNEKLHVLLQHRERMLEEAASISRITTDCERIVYFINSTKEQIVLRSQWNVPIMILQGLNKDNIWKNVQYWEMGYGCAEDMPFVFIPTNEQFSVVTNFPKGNYRTKLRYKVMGYDTFYYSEEFESSINYCAFLEECQNCPLRNRLIEIPIEN